MASPDHDDVERRLVYPLHPEKLPGFAYLDAVPLPLRVGAPTLLVRRASYERSGLVRAALDERLSLTPDEFRVEDDLVAIGPIFDGEGLATVLEDLERLGLGYYDDFFELSGNWPEWLSVLASSRVAGGRNSPSQPQR